MTTKTRTAPAPVTHPLPQPERYKPDDHCPGQRVRIGRKLRRVIEP